MNQQNIASTMDYTILKADALQSTIEKMCKEAQEYGFASICVNPLHVPLVSRLLKGSPVKTCCVIGFPLGASSSRVKAFETETAVGQGAEEVDMVINVGALKEGNEELVENDIRAVVKASGSSVVKVIIETCYLSDEEKVRACRLAEQAGADFVKTSTGFGSGGAKVEDVALMRKTVGKRLKVKASGGIRTRDDALKMLEAGADRLGVSAALAILGIG